MFRTELPVKDLDTYLHATSPLSLIWIHFFKSLSITCSVVVAVFSLWVNERLNKAVGPCTHGLPSLRSASRACSPDTGTLDREKQSSVSCWQDTALLFNHQGCDRTQEPGRSRNSPAWLEKEIRQHAEARRCCTDLAIRMNQSITTCQTGVCG